jgi:tetratricopeptide (TPR) repeat protein
LLTACGPDAATRFDRAQESFAAQDYTSARLDLQSALRESPGDARMLALLAHAQLREADGAGALATLEKLRNAGGDPAEMTRIEAEARLFENDPGRTLELLSAQDHPEAWRIKAGAHLRMDDPVAAAQAYRTGVKKSDASPLLISDYAWFLMDQGDVDGAAQLADRLEDEAPGILQTLLVRGSVAGRRRDYDTALASYREAREKYPRHFQPFVAEAETLGAMGRGDEIGDLVDTAMALAPGEPRVVLLQMRYLAETGEWEELRDLAQPRERALTTDGEENLLYAEALLRVGQTNQARARLSDVLRLAPENRRARRLLGEALMKSGDNGAAARTLIPLADNVDATREELSIALDATKRAQSPEAGRIAAMLKGDRPERIAALLEEGEVALSRGNYAGARDAFAKVTAIAGAHPMVLNNLAFAQMKAGDAAAAIATADKALSLSQGNPIVLDTAASARIAAGRDLGAARSMLERAIENDPQNALLREKLARLKRG